MNEHYKFNNDYVIPILTIQAYGTDIFNSNNAIVIYLNRNNHHIQLV